MKKISSVYKIQSVIKPERVYIGSSIETFKRWRRHLNCLKSNKHPNSKLQNHYNKYGNGDLIFSILLSCEKEDLLKIEQYFIDSYNPWFNICKHAGNTLGRRLSKETREKLSISHLGLGHSLEVRRRIQKSHKGLNTWMKGRKSSKETKEKISKALKIPIIQYSLMGEMIKEWDSTKSASKELSIHNTDISQNLRQERKSAGGFIWRYKNKLKNIAS